jgi:hypothetical protein
VHWCVLAAPRRPLPARGDQERGAGLTAGGTDRAVLAWKLQNQKRAPPDTSGGHRDLPSFSSLPWMQIRGKTLVTGFLSANGSCTCDFSASGAVFRALVRARKKAALHIRFASNNDNY